ncbi:MAG: hypothetical protein IPJ61_03215 [Tessaracoccus sp.]|uniref:hypothetical protein n=1 Tax=Tessaracoccus sp. TaxID=1971211 RepID=UPI001EB90055|nr:hypothetical protein [Tessaracoccus sp.]MBK7820097.1 hypothetical protein [Tessaracoccus sp.]
MNESELRAALKASTPPPADISAWAEVGRRRASRRRVGAGAAIVLVVAAAMGATLLPRTSPVTFATPSPSVPSSVSPTSPTPSPSVPDTAPGQGALVRGACADLLSGALAVEDLPASRNLASGAQQVWLCGGNGGFGRLVGMGPVEPLTTAPDRVVDAINALPGLTQNACTQVGGLVYTVVVEYHDGARSAVSAETVNCEWVGGWDARTGGAALLETLKGYWADQRASAPAFTDDVDLCRTYPAGWQDPTGITSFLRVGRAEVVRGVVCGLAADSVGFDGQTVSHPLPAEFVAALADAEVMPRDGWGDVPRGLPYLVLLNEHGDPVTFLVDAAGAIVSDAEGDGLSGTWMPTGEAASQWREALDGLRTTPFSHRPAECEGDFYTAPAADPAAIVGGWACVGEWAIPERGPALDPALAAELGRRFAAEAESADWGTRDGANQVVLADATGRLLPLYWSTQTPVTMVDEKDSLLWRVPDDLVEELRRYGLTFTEE